MTNELRILFQDDHYVAVHKPAGMLVHKSKMARDAKVFALQELRNQLNRQVYPCHRLDRKTSGVLLFALSEEALSKMRELWMNNEVKKEYLAIVRGHIPDEGEIDYPLVNEKEVEQEAFTRYSCLKRCEIPYSSGKF
ncbi:MAG: pseudouridine synthase, partial [Crocinitomicaceae bacterium]|nr:pseudouridine synthase [Crocinitomicaceae bacterium]